MRTVTGFPPGAAPAAPRPAERLEVRSADGTPLYVEVYGPPEATSVVLVHGWTGSIELWNRQLRDLSDQFRLIAYDQRGHGRSGTPRAAGYSADALADDLAAVLDATLRPAERGLLAGHSMGAATIVAVAGRHPELVRDRVAGVLLASTGVDELVVRGRLVPLPLPLARAARPLTTLLLTRRTSRRRDSWLTRRAVRYATLSRSASVDDVVLCTGMTVACAPGTRQGFARTLARLDLSAALPNLDVPAVVLVGIADRLTPVWHARRLAAALPRCLRLVEVPGVGHMTPLQAPAVIADAVRDLARTA
jgi:pimeloyl-ACP methyl ester carboxylesterase